MSIRLVDDTIVAIASPPGPSPLGIVRLSGADAFALAGRIARSVDGSAMQIPRTRQTLEALVQLPVPSAVPPGERPLVAPCYLFIMPSPRSYTREDVVEFVCSGSPPLLRSLLAVLCGVGARPAHAGEFTLRAFLNGRIDLAQAEAVERIVTASTEAERRGALDCLAGELSSRIREWQQTVLFHAATIEATLDFDEEEIDSGTGDDLVASLGRIEEDCQQLAEQARAGRDGDGSILVRLCGRTNAGKSALFNALAGDDAALVSNEPSTTRDRLRQRILLKDIRFTLEDAPGFDPEARGVAREAESRAADRLAEADLVVLVVDGSRREACPEADVMRGLPAGRTLAVFSQADRGREVEPEELTRHLPKGTPPPLCLSAVTGEGLDGLREALVSQALGSLAHEPSVGIGLREAAELAAAARHCRAARELAGSDIGNELVAEELRAARRAFGRSLGEDYTEDILNNIFHRFCIGK